MATLKVRKHKLNFLEQIYLVEVFRGMALTSRHFFRNLLFHALHAIGFKKLRGAVTIQYPEETRPLAPRLRTRHRLTLREDGSPRCVACMMCETICPARCIYIVAKEHPDPHIEKMPASFTIDLGKCVYCGFCVEACPEDAIRMDTQILNIAAYSREGMIYSMEELMHPEKQKTEDREQRTENSWRKILSSVFCLLTALFIFSGCSKEYLAAKYYLIKAEDAYEKAYALRVKPEAEAERKEYYWKAHDYFLRAYQNYPKLFTLTRIGQAHDACVRVEDREGAQIFERFAQEYSQSHPTEAEYGDATPLVGLE